MIKTPSSIDLSLILRGIFASAVVWWHTGGYRLDVPALESLNVSGRLAVWMFFGLSGYVIGYGFFKKRYQFTWAGVRGYLGRRAFRILPLFWIATFAALALLWLTGRPTVPTFRQLFAAQWQHIDYPVGVFWTLGVELQFYLIAPLLAWAMLASGRWALAAGVSLWLALWLSFGDTPDNRSMLGNLQHFVAGMLVARAYLSGYLQKLLSWSNAFVFAGIGIAAIAAANIFYHSQQFWTLHASLVSDVAIASLLIVHCAFERKQIAPGWLVRALMALGVLAYGLYAWHGVLLVVWPRLGDSFAATFSLSLAVAAVSYIALERPLIHVGKRLSAVNSIDVGLRSTQSVNETDSIDINGRDVVIVDQ